MATPDLGHQQTDKLLDELERRLAAVYRTAGREMQAKIDAYFESFRERDEQMKALIGTEVNGKIWTERDYKQWRLAQIGRGSRFEALRDALAERMTKANEVAAAYINDATPGVYSLNRNYTAYTIERVGGNIGFTLWDESTVKRLLKEQPDLMPYYPPQRAVKRGIDLEWGKKIISSQLTQSILQGENLKQMADRLKKNIPTMERDSAIRAARTAFTGAQNAGRMDSYKAAEDMGIKVQKRWVATKDGRTRHSHRRLDGETVAWDAKFSNGCRYPGDPQGKPEEVYNCFPGYIKVASDSEAIRSYKHMYYGRLITVKTSGGVEFTCTPNHPILTPSGWVRAESLNNGDNLIVTFARDYAFSGRYPNINRRFSRFDAFHELMNKFGGKRTRALGVNFHGDVATTYVEIVTKKRFLRSNRYSSGRKRIAEFFFKLSDKAFSGLCSFAEHFFSICCSSFGDISSQSVKFPFFRRHFRHTNEHGRRSSSDIDILLPKYAINDLPAETIIRGELLNGLSGKVFLDKIVSVEVSSSDCHVYNLQTQNGYYFVNSRIPQSGGKCNGIFAIAKNCRCTMRTVEKPAIEAEPRKMRVRDPKTGRNVLVNEMTYSEWERWVRERG